MNVQDTKAAIVDPVGSPILPSLPIIAIAGTRGKSTVSWLTDHILKAESLRTGLWTTSGVFMNGQHLVGELGPWAQVVEALAHGQLDVAVQELENSVITGVGLPENIYPVAAVTTLCGNNDECLITNEFQQGAIALDIVARAVRPDGYIILNADDHAVLAATEETEATVVMFALHPGNPNIRKHRESGGTAVWLDEDTIVVHANDETVSILNVHDAEFTLEGSLTFQVQNLLCAVALAWSLGISPESIRDGVLTFSPDPELMPGSCNFIESNGATVLLDSARQVWTVRSLVRGIRDSAFNRTVVVSDCFCHLSESQIIDAGRLLGRVADVVVTHRPESANGCFETFKDGLARNDVPPLVFAMPNETAAIEHALKLLDPGDLCVCLTGYVSEAISIIRRFSQSESQ